MSNSTLVTRGRALENAFFRRQEEQRIAKAKDQNSRTEKIVQLGRASGIIDEELLGHFVDMDLDADTLAALSLIPLIHVAWADGVIDERELKAIMKAAPEKGIKEGTPAYTLLVSWLEAEPGDLFKIWSDYIGALVKDWDPLKTALLKKDVVDRTSEVARAAGGFIGVGTVSASEKQALAEIAAAFGELG